MKNMKRVIVVTGIYLFLTMSTIGLSARSLNSSRSSVSPGQATTSRTPINNLKSNSVKTVYILDSILSGYKKLDNQPSTSVKQTNDPKKYQPNIDRNKEITRSIQQQIFSGFTR